MCTSVQVQSMHQTTQVWCFSIIFCYISIEICIQTFSDFWLCRWISKSTSCRI